MQYVLAILLFPVTVVLLIFGFLGEIFERRKDN